MNHKTTLYLLSVSILFCLCLEGCSKKEKTLFQKTDPSVTGITFANTLQESEEENILSYEYFYNGGGVAVGDVNNDGKVDIFFTGNQVANKLYLNKGDRDSSLKFEDISAKAGIEGRKGAWKTGVTMVDINADGWLDIYVCYSGKKEDSLRKNQLFINNHNLTFSEKAVEYGLDDWGYSTQAAFFDYDLDGDLDCFLINHNLKNYQRKEAAVMRAERDYNAGDKLFRNDNQKFTEVTAEAGIKSNALGFGLGLVISDVNNDGYPDIYVGNDYVEDDYLYINQKNGTGSSPRYKDELRERIDHTSNFTMGVDIADINNDQLPDIFSLDMLPEDNIRQKSLIFPDNWNVYQAQLNNGFWHQNMRNMLQVNANPKEAGHFSEISHLANVATSDWSWGTIMADFDLDGYKDIFVSNGILKDFTNSDFVKFQDDLLENGVQIPTNEVIKRMESSQTKNYIFRNKHNLTFSNEQVNWGFDEPTISNGTMCADLDNDGDLDLITNNNNATACIYQNTTQENSPVNYLKIRLKGSPLNSFGIGAKVFIQTDSLQQSQEFSPVRGFESSSCDALLFGIGETRKLTVTVEWANHRTQTLTNVKPNQVLILDYAKSFEQIKQPVGQTLPLLAETDNGLDFIHKEDYKNDFDYQILLPYHPSYQGSKMAVGDVNADGLEDVYVGGAKDQGGMLFLQKTDGKFTAKPNSDFAKDAPAEDRDAVFLDADKDGDLDLYVVSGNYSERLKSEWQADRLYINDGNGIFKKDLSAIPTENINSSCVKAFDIDRDGDKDLVIGGSVLPNSYPYCEESYLLINNGKGKFGMKSLGKLGLVTSMAVADFNKDKQPDLVVVGEWMQPTILLNQNGKFTADASGLIPENLHGWWNSVAADDLDGDGDEDLVMGNLGLNSIVKANINEPATLNYGDFDNNMTIDPYFSYYIQGKSYPAIGRDEALEQVASLRKTFIDYKSYSSVSVEEMFTKEILDKNNTLTAENLETCLLENTGKGFIIKPLPFQSQYAPVCAIAIEDMDKDGKKDILLCGNQSKFRLRIGKIDANHGVLLKGKGKLNYEYQTPAQSGLWLRGDVRDIKHIGKSWVFSVCDGKVISYW
ncbi:MAG: VCBS repeat-containing protein [Arcicella sp.]|nr:VCBS repeat-containing protein [Arcicella sp.]